MARRMIECKTWKSYQVGQLTFRQRCLWIGLITVADDQGRGHAHPGILIGAIFPYDEITHGELQADMDYLADLGLIHLYQNGDGAPLYQIVKWWRYQRPTWAWPSALPAPDGWTDREKYREGNSVVETHWETDGGFCSDDSDPTVTPQRGQSEDSDRVVESSIEESSGSEDDPRNPFSLYEQTNGPLSKYIADELNALIDEMEGHRQGIPAKANGHDVEGEKWVCLAIEEAAQSTDSFNLKYLKRILDRWKRDGLQAKRGGNGKGSAYDGIDFGG